MDLQQLEKDLKEFQERYNEWHYPIYAVERDGWERIKRNEGYTKADLDRDIMAKYYEQIAKYNPDQAFFPIREAMLAYYVKATSEQRAQIRIMVRDRSLYRIPQMLIRYIYQCAECLETPEDGWILHSGLVAAAIENYAWDFRDTGEALSELGMAALQAQIDIESIAREVTPLCSPKKQGYMSTRSLIENFYNVALKAKKYRTLYDVSPDE